MNMTDGLVAFVLALKWLYQLLASQLTSELRRMARPFLQVVCAPLIMKYNLDVLRPLCSSYRIRR